MWGEKRKALYCSAIGATNYCKQTRGKPIKRSRSSGTPLSAPNPGALSRRPVFPGIAGGARTAINRNKVGIEYQQIVTLHSKELSKKGLKPTD